ncbi:MAG: 30S ribosomal protein S2 [Candidatus Pacebacteria bacterium]|nr:30S ribosomal protein S2 [Candidatus Paceibacterota bacterium]
MAKVNEALVNEMFEAGAHVGYSKTRRHPSAREFVFDSRQKKDIIDLEKTTTQLETALGFLKELQGTDKQVLFVGTKAEARRLMREAAELIDMPFVTERWLGGTLTNAKEIRSRVDRLIMLQDQAEKGELVAATKKEKLMLEREIERLEKKFGGLKTMKKAPAALFVIDSKKEEIAVTEARQMNIPVIAIANTDCDVSIINYPIVANDTNVSSIALFTNKVADVLK